MIKEYLTRMKPRIEELLEQYYPKKSEDEAIQKGIIDPTWNLLSRGGKRLRPALYLLILGAYKQPGEDERLCILPELLHNGTLIIDDIEDSSEVRRSQPAIHKIYGEDISINAGNRLYFAENQVLKGIEPVLELNIRRLISHTMEELHHGQAMDIYWHRHGKNPSQDQYLDMCKLKTGAMFGFSCRLAALAAGRPKQEQEQYELFGRTLGVAFQIQDDILNLESPDEWTKRKGDDITEGKRTLIVLHALKNSPQNKRLEHILNQHPTEKERIDEAISIMVESRSIDYAKAHAQQMASEAWDIIEHNLPEHENKQAIKQVIHYFIERKV